MNADFVRCCDFLARMIEKYGPEIRAANMIYLKSSEVDCWKYNPKKQEDRIFSMLRDWMHIKEEQLSKWKKSMATDAYRATFLDCWNIM